jgi:exosortase
LNATAPPDTAALPARVRRADFGNGLLAAAALSVAGAIYFRVAPALWTVWTTNDNYSHGPLVPFVALALAWMRRHDLAAAAKRPDARGLAFVALACVMMMLGMRSDVFALQAYSMLPMLFGLALTFFGGEVARMLAFPILYLAFMLTFPPLLMNTLSYALKEITLRLSTGAAEALGVTLQRSGMTLYLQSGELRMENPCSGLRSLLALLATGAVFAYLQPGAWWRRLLVLLAAVPIAMAGNAVRITLLILVGHYGSVEQAGGSFHDWSGYLIYIVALAGLMMVRAALMPRAPAKAS